MSFGFFNLLSTSSDRGKSSPDFYSHKHVIKYACHSGWNECGIPESPSGKENINYRNRAFLCFEEIPVFRFAPTGMTGRGQGDSSMSREMTVRGKEKPMVEIERKEDTTPICPHCKTELKKIWFQELRGVLGRRYIYFCPHCKSTLGVSHRKGFWMG